MTPICTELAKAQMAHDLGIYCLGSRCAQWAPISSRGNLGSGVVYEARGRCGLTTGGQVFDDPVVADSAPAPPPEPQQRPWTDPKCPRCGARVCFSLHASEKGARSSATCMAVEFRRLLALGHDVGKDLKRLPDPDCEWTGQVERTDGGGVAVVAVTGPALADAPRVAAEVRAELHRSEPPPKREPQVGDTIDLRGPPTTTIAAIEDGVVVTADGRRVVASLLTWKSGQFWEEEVLF